MGTYDVLQVGDRFTTPSRVLDDATVRALVEVGGYTHPLFTDPAYAAASPFGATPVPGEGVLHLMGGLIEQSERFDDTTIALIGFEQVTFSAPAFEGDEIRVECDVVAKEPRGRMTFLWRCVNQRDETLVTAGARMLFRTKT